ncbi:MAG: CBS domain-containing protein [Candidatus Aminicenantes bacterium]|nr:CBS domain-containing protein [Candidatus Aminicenantes bacterium]
MFGKRISLFKLFGFHVKMDFSWFILAILIIWSLARGLFPHFYEGFSATTYWIMGVAGALGLLFSIVFHELWHSLIARRYGLPMKGITLFIFGGVAEMSEQPPSPKAEFFMAVAGPLASIVLGSGLLIISLFSDGLGLSKAIKGVIEYLAWINLILAGFNLIPAFPLDGGRVLRSVLWGWKENINWATNIASKIGSAFGFALILFGVFQVIAGNFIGGAWMFLIGLFIRSSSQMSYKQMILRNSLSGQKVDQYMNSDPAAVSPDINLEELIEEYIYKYHYKMYPVVDQGSLVGCVELKNVKDIPKEDRSSTKVREIMEGCSESNTIRSDEDAEKALSHMQQNKRSRLMVVERDQLVGVISIKDLMDFLSVKIDLGD